MPILALLPFIDRNFEEKFAVLRKGPEGKGGYMTVKQALEDGAVVLRYGYVIDFYSSSALRLEGRVIKESPETICGGLHDGFGIGSFPPILTTPHHSAFINHIFTFLGIGLSLYIIANIYTWVSNDAVIKNTVKCKFCRKRISEKVCLFIM